MSLDFILTSLLILSAFSVLVIVFAFLFFCFDCCFWCKNGCGEANYRRDDCVEEARGVA